MYIWTDCQTKSAFCFTNVDVIYCLCTYFSGISAEPSALIYEDANMCHNNKL